MKYDIEALKRKMLVKYPFFGSVVASVSYKENNNIPTAGTDGKIIYYNPKYLEGLSVEEQTFVFAHEVCHIAFNHILRSEGKNSRIWNIATDAVINQFLKRDGLKLAPNVVDMEEAINYDAEQLYEKLLQEKQQRQNQQSNSQSKQNNQKQSSGGQQNDDDKQQSQSQQQNNLNNKSSQEKDKKEGQQSEQDNNQSKQDNQQQSGGEQNDDDKQQSQSQQQNNLNNKSSQEKDKKEGQQSEQDNNQSKQDNQQQSGGEQNDDDKQQSQSQQQNNLNNKSSQEKDKKEGQQSEQDNNQSKQDNQKQSGGEQNDDDKQQSQSQQQGNLDDKNSQDKQNEGKNTDEHEEDSQEDKLKQDIGHDTHSMWEQAVKKYKEQKEKGNENKNLSDELLKDKDKTELEKKQEELEGMGEKDAFKKNLEDKKRQLEELKEAILRQASQAGMSTNREIRKVNDIGTAKPLIDWRYVLREAIKYDVDWSYKNATLEDGVVCANLEEQPMPETEIVLDTSGSINEVLLKNFLRECKNILQCSRLKVGCFDTEFYGFHEIRTEKDIENMQFEGSGGTDFNVAVGAFSRRVENKIIFTDGESPMPKMPIDAIWIVFGDEKINPVGGRVIYIDDEKLKKLCNCQITTEVKGRLK